MAKETVSFNSGADRASMQMGLEERFEKGSLLLSAGGSANGLTFEAQRDQELISSVTVALVEEMQEVLFKVVVLTICVRVIPPEHMEKVVN